MQVNSNLKLFGRYASLNVLGMIGLSCYILADTFFVAQGVGSNGLTALSLALPVYSVTNGTGLMIGMGGATRFSISKSSSIFTRSLVYGWCVAIVYLLCGIFLSGALATALGADTQVHEFTKTYLQILLLFSPLFLTNNILNCFVRNDNDPRLSMIAMLAGTFTNIVFDYILVFPCNLGIGGAALATGFSPLISICILSTHFFSKKNNLKFKKAALKVWDFIKSVKDISALGIAALITELSSGIVLIVFNNLILRLEGNLGVAAYGIIANIAIVVNSIFTGIAEGSQPIISRSYGEGRFKDAKKILKYGIISAVIFAAVFYITSFIFTEPIVKLFDSEGSSELISMAVHGFRIYFLAAFFLGINILVASYFTSIDRAANGFIISLCRGLAVIVPVSVLMSFVLGLDGVWLSLCISELIVCGIGAFLLKKRNI